MLRTLALFLAIAAPAYASPLTYEFASYGKPGSFTYDSDTGDLSLVFAAPGVNSAHVFDLTSSGVATASTYGDHEQLTAALSQPVPYVWPDNLDAYSVYGYDVSFRMTRAPQLFADDGSILSGLAIGDFSGYVDVMWHVVDVGPGSPYGSGCEVGTPPELCPLSSYHYGSDYLVRYYFSEFHDVSEPTAALLVCLAGLLGVVRLPRLTQ